MYKVHGYHVTPNVIIIEWEQGGAQSDGIRCQRGMAFQ